MLLTYRFLTSYKSMAVRISERENDKHRKKIVRIPPKKRTFAFSIFPPHDRADIKR